MSIVILCTRYSNDYFNNPQQRASYELRFFTPLMLRQLQDLQYPVRALGVYVAEHSQTPFKLLKVNTINTDNANVCFDIEPLPIHHNIPSADFQRETNRLVELRDDTQIIDILHRLNIAIPQEWTNNGPTPPISWEDWIGSYFKKLNSDNISSDDFENITAHLLKALGFQIEQMGHTRQGAFPDGIIKAPNLNFAFIYDCKYANNYYPITDDSRAMDSYMNHEGARLKETNPNLKVYPCFIARSFANNVREKANLYLTVENLLYILFKRLKKGLEFSLVPFERAYERRVIDRQFIDNNFQ